MKIILLVVTIMFLIARIKGTPRMLSKRIYDKYSQEVIENLRKMLQGKTKEESDAIKNVIPGIVLLFQFLCMIYYFLVGVRFSSNSVLLVLSAIQITSILASLKNDLQISKNLDSCKFHRLYFLFLVVLDYTYYPMTIYMLLQ